MKINKQLFEDVLSGKLKGKFIFRNVHNIHSVELKPNHTCIEKPKDGFYIIRMPYLLFNVVNTDGKSVYGCTLHKGDGENDLNYDVIDFIPEINMKENELTIEIPDNKVVDWEESKKQNKIILKDKQLTYEDICKKLFENKEFFFTNNTGAIQSSSPTHKEYLVYAINNSTSYHQLECILAKNMLANVAVYLNDGWKPIKTSLGQFAAWTLNTYNNSNGCYIGCVKISSCSQNSNVLFKSRELALQAIEILGEEIVKLALEPLGI